METARAQYTDAAANLAPMNAGCRPNALESASRMLAVIGIYELSDYR